MGLNEAQKKERSEYLEKYLEITECSQKKPYVFISYASDNWETVFKTAVVPMQKRYGLSVYADKAFDKVNDKWIVPMLRNIRGADVVVAFVSQSYIESYACFLELLTAVNNRKQIVFVSLEDHLHLGDTTDLPEVERGVKSEILNQGANIATNTNNTSNDIMRAMKSAYTSLSTLLEQDALSKYDISDAFINFFRDASINRKTINDLNAVRGTIRSVSDRVFDRSLIVEPVRQPEPAPAAAEPVRQPEPVPVAAGSTEEPAPEPAPQPAPEPETRKPSRPEPAREEQADFSWGDEKPGKQKEPGKKPNMKWILTGAAALVVVLAFVLLSGGTKEVTDEPYTMTDGSSAQFSGVYTGQWSKRDKWPSGEGTFVLDDDGGTYTGQWVDGVAEGQGSMTWADGASYEGEWLAGMRTGQGTMTYADETVYVGEFKENKREGQGRRTWPDGGFVEGEWKNDEVNGQGQASSPVGGDKDNPEVQTYVGEYVNSQRDGYGTYTWPSGQKYEGEWKEGKFNGKGTLTYSNGNVFEGTFVDGEKDGDAVYTLTDGTVINEKWDHGAKYVTDMDYTTPAGAAGSYTGFWDLTNERPQGQGTMEFENGQVYEGEWAEGVRSGQGRCTWPDGGYYDGEWKDDKYNGQGINYMSGDENNPEAHVYEGSFVDGHRSGYGVYTWPNGEKFEGEWKDGKRNGKGVYTYTDGSTYEGEYVDSERNGEGVYTAADGTKVTQVWDHGTKVED